MVGKVGIRGLRIFCKIGCLENEWDRKQEVLIHLEVQPSWPFSEQEMVDYRELKNICEVASESPHRFLEELAEKILENIRKAFPFLHAISLTLEKPHAFLSDATPYVSIDWQDNA